MIWPATVLLRLLVTCNQQSVARLYAVPVSHTPQAYDVENKALQRRTQYGYSTRYMHGCLGVKVDRKVAIGRKRTWAHWGGRNSA